MTTISSKKTCVKCVKGTGIVTCDGCQQSFCHNHLSEHRTELLHQMEQIDNECEHFRHSLGPENDPSPILSAIDQWEHQSIERIRVVAEKARADVHQLTERTLNEFNDSIDKITTSIHASRKTNDLTELDLKQWTAELQLLQDLLKEPFPISLINDEKIKPAFTIIKVRYDPPITDSVRTQFKNQHYSTGKTDSHSSTSKHVPIEVEERFDRVAGHVTLSDDNSTATCVGYSSICGSKLYSTGVHRIRFRVIAKKNEGIFLGIMTAKQAITARASELPSVYGWRDFDRTIINGNGLLKVYKEKNIEPDDQFTLTVDCTHSKLVLTHHQLEQRVQMSIDRNKCPFPWKLLVSSFGDDIIRILH